MHWPSSGFDIGQRQLRQEGRLPPRSAALGQHGQRFVSLRRQPGRVACRLFGSVWGAALARRAAATGGVSASAVYHGAELGTGLVGRVPARRGANHWPGYHGTHVFDSDFLPRIGAAARVSTADVFEPADAPHRNGARPALLGSPSKYDPVGVVCGRLSSVFRAGLCLVPEVPQRICRCPLRTPPPTAPNTPSKSMA